MKLAETGIFPFIKTGSIAYETVILKRNEIIVDSEERINGIWYLVHGRVRVMAESYNGKSIRADLVEEDNFVGHLSQVYGQNLFCRSIADIKSTLVFIPAEQFDALMATEDFSRFFYNKTGARLCNLYKMDLARSLFTQKQQLAYYLMTNKKGAVCNTQSYYKMCDELRISRRNLYNLLDKLKDEGLVERSDDGTIRIVDEAELKRMQEPMAHFFAAV